MGHWGLLAVPAVLYQAVVYVFPLVGMVALSVLSPKPGWENFGRLAENASYAQIFIQTFWIAAVVTVVCLVIGYPVAYYISTASPFVRRLLLGGVIAPYLMSVLVRTFAWQVLLGRDGLITQGVKATGLWNDTLLFTGAAVVMSLVHILLPVMILPVMTVMNQVDRSLPRAARSLGAGPAQAFVRVFVPLTIPGIQVGAVLVFVYGIGSFITPQILGGRAGIMLGVIIERAIDQLADFGFAAAVAVVLIASVAAVVGIYQWRMAGSVQWLLRPESAAQSRVEHHSGRGPSARLVAMVDRVAATLDGTGLSRTRAPLAAWTCLVIAFLLLPQLVSIPISLSPTRSFIFPPVGVSGQWYVNFLSAEWLPAAGVSLAVAIVAAVGSSILGALAAVAATRSLGPRTSTLVSSLMIVPLLIPSIVTAVALYVVFVQIGLTDSVLGIVLAHIAIATPFAFTIVAANVRALSRSYEQAARSLGAGSLAVLWRIVFPLIRPGVLVALLFTFLTSFDEAVIAIFLSGVHVRTLPRRMFEAITLESDPTIGVVATISMVLALAVLLGSGAAQRVERQP